MSSAHVPTRPRVGGIEDDDGTKIAWVGGSNDFSHTEPLATNCFRPTKLKYRRDLDNLLKQGLPAEKRLSVDNRIGVMSWCRELHRALRELGLDTIFQFVPIGEAHRVNSSVLINLLTSFGKVTYDEVVAYEKRLISGDVPWAYKDPTDPSKGTLEPTPKSGCRYDISALKDSKKFLRGCIDTSLFGLVDPEVPDDAFGPAYLMKIFQKKSGMSPNTIRDLATKLGTMSLRDEPGENVAAYATKIKEKAQTIHGSMYCPPDLTFLSLKGFADSSCQRWNSYANQTVTKYDGASVDCDNWINEIPILVSKYDARSLAEDWPGAAAKAPHKEAQESTIAAMIAASVKSAIESSSHGKFIKKKPDGKEKGPPGPVYDQNNPNPKKMRPAPGDSHRKTFPDGVTRYWCGTCGRWTISHYQSGHGVDSHDPTIITPITEPTTGSAPPPAQAPPPEASGHLALDMSGLNFIDANLVYGNYANVDNGISDQDFPPGGHHV